ncbi:neurochondrin, partial [Trifolium pratense]
DIASSEDMNSNIPLMLEVFSMSSSSVPSSVLEECCEFLYLVLTASEKGIMKFYEFSGIKILALRLRALQGNEDDSRMVDMCIKLLQLIISRISLDKIQKDYLFELSIIVVALARQFAILHNSLKFEALHILNSVICSIDLSQLVKTLQDSSWSDDIRVGIVAILQNRVAAAERLQVLILAESMVSIFGEDWLIVGQVSNTNDMCLLLVLEQSRVEIAVLLNDLAYLKYEAPQDTLATIEAHSLKQRNVSVAYSLVEKIIKLISNVGENGVNLFDEGTLTKLILQLNETIAVVLEYLEDAKEHGQRKGDDLLASVRIIGSYLAEAPLACNEKVRDLLGLKDAKLSLHVKEDLRLF